MHFYYVCYNVTAGSLRRLNTKELMVFQTEVLEKTLESPLDSKEIQAAHPKGNRSWIFTGRTDAEDEAPFLWPPEAKSQLFGKDPDPGRDWRREEKGMTEDEMVGWHQWLDVHEFEQAPGVGEEQGSLACCSPWGRTESDMTERLNWPEASAVPYSRALFTQVCEWLYLL